MPGAVATLFAAAHQRVHGARAAAHRGDGVFWLPGPGHERRRTIEAGSAEALVAAVPALSSAGEVEIRFTLDPDQPVESFVPPPPAPDDNWVEPAEEAVEAVGAAANLVLLAGPGVVAQGSVPGLHDLAVSAGVGVLNTWGAKGVFDWRSRHHLATIGLQADDFVLSGLDRADLIIATGLDHAESPDDRWRLAPALTIPPAGLAPFAERCRSHGPRAVDHAAAAGPPGGGDAAGMGCRDPAAVAEPRHHALCGTGGRRCAGRGRRRRRRLLGGAHARHDPARGGDRPVDVRSGIRRRLRGGLAAPSPRPSGAGRDRPRPGRGDGSGRLGRCGDAGDPCSGRGRGTPTAIVSMPMPIGSGCAGCSSAGLPAGNGLCTLATDPRQLSEMIEVAGPIVAWT